MQLKTITTNYTYFQEGQNMQDEKPCGSYSKNFIRTIIKKNKQQFKLTENISHSVTATSQFKPMTHLGLLYQSLAL